MECNSIHSCLKIQEDNRRLKKVVQKLKEKNTELEKELNGFREREKIQDILRTHVNTRNSYAQTDPSGDWNYPALKSNSRYGIGSLPMPVAQRDANEAIVKLANMQNVARNNYERELKKNSKQAEHISAQDLQITQLKEELKKAKCQISEMESKNHCLQETLQKRSASTVKNLEKKVSKLQEENSALRDELRGLDAGFFEEVEDLKYALAESQRLQARYEVYCAGLASQLGLKAPNIEIIASSLTDMSPALPLSPQIKGKKTVHRK